MSHVPATLTRPKASDWWELDEETPLPGAVDSVAPSRPTLAESWLSKDPVDELIDQLGVLGRTAEASLIARSLREHKDITTEDVLRALASDSFSEDWLSDEDSYYDTL